MRAGGQKQRKQAIQVKVPRLRRHCGFTVGLGTHVDTFDRLELVQQGAAWHILRVDGEPAWFQR